MSFNVLACQLLVSNNNRRATVLWKMYINGDFFFSKILFSMAEAVRCYVAMGFVRDIISRVMSPFLKYFLFQQY